MLYLRHHHVGYTNTSFYSWVEKSWYCSFYYVLYMWRWYNLNSILQIPWCSWFPSPAFHFSRNGLDTMKTLFFRKEKFCFNLSRASSEYRFITKSWLLGDLSLYSKRELTEGTIIRKVTILGTNIKLPHIFLIKLSPLYSYYIGHKLSV